ncbi:hypothetical protein EDB87DRAFT_736822 [Lactarius vividus]|nr:hypothetical protein EDB87DRAFT_736822 [Lactarius vividus]
MSAHVRVFRPFQLCCVIRPAAAQRSVLIFAFCARRLMVPLRRMYVGIFSNDLMVSTLPRKLCHHPQFWVISSTRVTFHWFTTFTSHDNTIHTYPRQRMGPESVMANTHDPVDAGHYQPQTPKLDSLSEVGSTNSAQLGEDLSLAVRGMYPLLDLITEQGSSGLVDKIVIAQQSLQEFINTLSPGAYSSITEVDFKLLDNVVLKPFGIYGSKEEIVRFLSEIKAVDDSTVQKFLLPRNGLAGGSSEPVLRSGLYITPLGTTMQLRTSSVTG